MPAWLRTMLPIIALGIAVIAGQPAAVSAHEGHDHDAAPASITTSVAPRAEASSDDFELVVVARGTELVVYLDTFRGNEPVEGAKLEIDTPSGILKPVAKSPGIYSVAAPFLAKPGSFDLAVTVTAGDKVDLVATTLVVPTTGVGAEPLGTSLIVSPASAQGTRGQSAGRDIGIVGAAVGGFICGALAVLFWRRRRAVVALAFLSVLGFGTTPDANAASEPQSIVRDLAQRLPDGSVFVSKATQHILALRTALTDVRTHAGTIELPGRIVPDPNASGLVQASVGGRLFPPDGGFKPLGTAVKAGDILAYIRPPLPSADATVQAQQARELDQQLSIVGRRVERYQALAPSGAVARSQLEDAELELRGLKERRGNLDRVNREPEALKAPVDGVIAAANAVAGQMAEPNSVIFQIIDPARLWVEALAFEPRSLSEGATARLGDSQTLNLKYLGTGLADRNQSLPVQFAIEGDVRGLRPGQFLTVLARTGDQKRGIAIPRTSVLRGSNGQSIIYEHITAERFVPREVRVEPLDGERVLIVAGVEAGKRIVTQGAELLNQIR